MCKLQDEKIMYMYITFIHIHNIKLYIDSNLTTPAKELQSLDL